jgi:hypothetical protein
VTDDCGGNGRAVGITAPAARDLAPDDVLEQRAGAHAVDRSVVSSGADTCFQVAAVACNAESVIVPEPLNDLIDELYASPGVKAVVIGGSRAVGRERPDSDWDIGVYYRNKVDLSALETRGEVFPPGAWGRIMNGGSWLTVDDVRVDVLLRDLDALDHWTAEAAEGRFDIDGLPGYVAGIPTYTLIAEASVRRTIRGSIQVDSDFPDALRKAGPQKWRFNRDFSLYHAEMHAHRESTAGVIGHVARAVFEEAHARCCAASTWVLNEKHVVSAAGLDDIHAQLVLTSPTAPNLATFVDHVRERLHDPLNITD